MTPKEVAEIFRVSRDTVVRIAQQRKDLGAFRIGHQWRIPRSAVALLARDWGVASGYGAEG